MSAIEDKERALSGDKTCNWRAEELVKSAEFRKEYATRPNVVKAEDMPWERSPDGLIKHLIHRNMNTPELRCLIRDRKSTRLNSSHVSISYAVFCLKKKKTRSRTRSLCSR